MERAERERLEREPCFVTASSPSPATSAAPLASDTDPMSWSARTTVEGRVFRRLQRFHVLSLRLKAQSDMVATYLLAPKVRHRVFEQRDHWWQHPLHLSKAGVGTFVQGRKLLKSILEYLLLSNAANNSLCDAQQVAEGLVLSGFLSPVNEAPEADIEPLGELYVSNDEYYELVAPGAASIVPTPNALASASVGCGSENSLPGTIVSPVQPQRSPTNLLKPSRPSPSTLSVWAMTDGATRAGFVLRRSMRKHIRSLFGVAAKLRRCYAVVNKTKRHSLVLFDTDAARRELVCVELPAVTVEYYVPAGDNPECFCLKICRAGDRRDGSNSCEGTMEVLDLQSKAEQEQWLLALVDAGAAFLETHPAILSFASSLSSLYSLRDTDARGNPFQLSTLRGHVALLTNATSGSCYTNAAQLWELAELSKKYHSAGLRVVAFPCTQFGDAEFETDEELVEHFQELFGARFPVLATRDVNGPNARDALLFCKTRAPGAAKSAANAFIENDFVKFLVSRDGQVVKRYNPADLPLSMEADIQDLLRSKSAVKA
ncbi:unnamed protein product [Phytophthora fragariaefolia]|uniref:Unnamed protein product n=1 Tax=Phytophthora fragariaefolia TaxID=1490495 RepID=A0A9W6Y5W8_9STRA|nr:unnamed protein product [Phytophthora fragariaefolia]